MKLSTKDAQHTLSSRNYDVGSADGDDDGDDVDFERPASDGSFDFQGKNLTGNLRIVCFHRNIDFK